MFCLWRVLVLHLLCNPGHVRCSATLQVIDKPLPRALTPCARPFVQCNRAHPTSGAAPVLRAWQPVAAATRGLALLPLQLFLQPGDGNSVDNMALVSILMQ